MKVPIKWLNDYVDIDMTDREIADALTLSGSKVEEIIVTGDEIKNVVTGRIDKIERHPDAEKLVVCSVNVNKDENIQIVTGADNIKEGDIVPVALHGALLPGNIKIKNGKLRGVASNGMLCSTVEIGLPEDDVHGIMILDKNIPLGKDIVDVLEIKEAVIDFEITSNRPDCLSVVGIAREVAATTNKKLREPSRNYNGRGNFDTKDLMEIEIKTDKCDRFMAVAIKNVKIKESPKYISDRLIKAGIRPINNIVDITNYVMLETGYPLHAYDAREITTSKIEVDEVREKLKFTTLDGINRELEEKTIVIKDGDKNIIGVAGIMGGIDSEVKEDTTTIILECANFDGNSIRNTSKKLNIRTEASQRFEKNINGSICNIALERALYLIEEFEIGEISRSVIDINNTKDNRKTLELSSQFVNSFLGSSITVEEMSDYLTRLEFKVEIVNEDIYVKAPEFRIDIEYIEDIAEEIARIYGYNKIPSTIDRAFIKNAGRNEKQILDEILMNTMVQSSLYESISYAFCSPKVFDLICLNENSTLRNAIAIRNPLGEDFSLMRTSTIPSMMESISRNIKRGNKVVRLFERGRIYIPKENELLPDETNILTIGVSGETDYFELKGYIENIAEAFKLEGLTYQRIESCDETFHPGKTAEIYYKKEKIGVIGEIHPSVLNNYDLKGNVYIGEINLDILYKYINTKVIYKHLPKYPEVTRDIAIVVDETILSQEIESIIKTQGGKYLESVNMFDIYRGKPLEENKKSIAYALSFRAYDKTLSDKDIDKSINKIVTSIEYNLKGTLRS